MCAHAWTYEHRKLSKRTPVYGSTSDVKKHDSKGIQCQSKAAQLHSPVPTGAELGLKLNQCTYNHSFCLHNFTHRIKHFQWRKS